MKTLLRRLATLAAVFTSVCTLFVTHLPGPRAFGVSEADPEREAVRGVWVALGELVKRLPDLPHVFDPIRSDKTIHVIIFLVPAAFWALSFGSRLPRRTPALLLALATWATLDEGSQALAGRDGEWGDWIANLVGVGLGVAMAWPVVWGVSRIGARLAARGPAPPTPPASRGGSDRSGGGPAAPTTPPRTPPEPPTRGSR